MNNIKSIFGDREFKPNKLFHISEDPNIKLFEPRPSPSSFESINGDVVFTVTQRLLHNYLLPRDCPRVTFYLKHDSIAQDKAKFFGASTSDFVVAIESKWYEIIKHTKLYCYELPVDTFEQLDEGAGYFISYDKVTPISIRKINDILAELLARNVEIRIMPSIWDLAEEVSKSTLQFSIIRM